MIATMPYRGQRLTALAALLVVATLTRHVSAVPVILSGAEPDPNCAELRLWLRADSGIKDIGGRGPEDPDFNGRVAVWKDRSSRKCDLAAARGQMPLFVQREPAAGNRPMVAFNGEQVLTRANAAIHDRPTSTMVLVVMAQPKFGNHPIVYGVGQGPGRRERLLLVFNNPFDPSLDRMAGLFPTDAGERECFLDLGLSREGRTGGRVAVILVHKEKDRHSLEFHDGVGDLTGGKRVTFAETPACDKCSPEFCLGGDAEGFFLGQIAETMVFNRGLSVVERRDLLKYLRRRYELDMTESLLPPNTFLIQAEDFEGDWTRSTGNYLGRQCVTAEGKAADEGIKTTIHVSRNGVYQVWVRAAENSFGVSGPDRSTLKTIVQGKDLRVTHLRGPGGFAWRHAGEAELKAGPVEILIRGEGPGNKACDAVFISPSATMLEEVEAFGALAQRVSSLNGTSRLTAVFDGGLRLDGSLATGWRWMGPSGQVSRPDPVAMPPMICLQFDRRQDESEPRSSLPPEPVLEFLNGDRLRASIVDYVPATVKRGEEIPAHWIVRPANGYVQDPKQTVSVEIDWVRRIVFEPSPRDRRCPPKTLICRDGRRYSFRAIRWGAESLSVLTEDGIERIPLRNVAELRMAADDAWETYYRELSVIDPEGKAGIIRLETTDGMAFTSSTVRSSFPLRPAQLGQAREAVAAHRLIQPVWSRQPISVPWAATRFVWQAPAHVVPLSRFVPEQVTQRGTLGSSWRWQTDRNVADGILRSGGLDYLWGFGVHAPCEMVFPLPDCVRAFRASVGIDDVVGRAGRAVARVYLNRPTGTPFYQSNALVGSRGAISTGEVALPAASGRQLVLTTDNDGDPLDIGNHVDWLEPTLLLDPAKLQTQVGKKTVTH